MRYALPLLLLTCGLASAQDWPMFRLDPAHSAASGAPAAIGVPEVRWRFATGGVVESSAAIADGVPIDVVVPRETAAVTATDRQIRTQILSRPHLLLMSGEEQEIFAGDNIPIPIQESSSEVASPVSIRQRIEPQGSPHGGAVPSGAVERHDDWVPRRRRAARRHVDLVGPGPELGSHPLTEFPLAVEQPLTRIRGTSPARQQGHR